MIEIEDFLSKPYWIVDILPKQVPANAGGQYFTIEKYFLSPPHVDVIHRKFANIMLKLNCYEDFMVFQIDEETWTENPNPNELDRMVLERKPLFVILKHAHAMISITGEDHNMTVYGANEETLRLLSSIALTEGLNVWKP